MLQVLNNHSIFENKTVRGALKVLSTLIDWNDITYFNCCMDKIREFLRQKHLRTGAFQCLGALVGKGMAELDKLNIIRSSGYLEEVRDATYNLLNNFEEYEGTDEYDEEKNYMIAVSTSVSHIGKWCISLQKPEEGKIDPFTEPSSREFFSQVSQFLLEKAIAILDTDCFEVGWPMIDFLTPWI